ncbi:MAG TPA: HepT-like ribonuclease domain-containing protein [Thermoanaerobaculia bacterium]|nr:HepT-like ribonuclease domain-containing protein [Thermoanaerobaculia bacterium]
MITVLDRMDALRQQLDHLRYLRPQVTDPEILRGNLSLSNNVLRSLQVICQAVIDIAGDLSARRRLRFEDYSTAIRNLSVFPEFPASLIQDLGTLPELRDIIVHKSSDLDYACIIEVLDHLGSVEQFMETVCRMETTA